MATQPPSRLTPEQYLEIERKSEFKSEYYAGEMFAMSGGTLAHSAIAMSLGGSLATQLRGRPCRALSSDMRVLVSPTGLYTYPDVTVVCAEPQLLDSTRDTLLNPTLVVEVLSPSSEAYDRGRKFEHYRSIESLRQYLLVASDRVHLDLFTRQSGGQWLLTSASALEEKVELESIGCSLLVGDVYEKVEFETA